MVERENKQLVGKGYALQTLLKHIEEVKGGFRAYDAYMAGADGIFLFNGPSSDPKIGGIPPYYAYMNNKTLMEKWYTFEYPQSLFTEKISFLTNGAKLSVTVEGKKDVLDLPVTDAAWKAAPSLTENDLKDSYKA